MNAKDFKTQKYRVCKQIIQINLYAKSRSIGIWMILGFWIHMNFICKNCTDSHFLCLEQPRTQDWKLHQLVVRQFSMGLSYFYIFYKERGWGPFFQTVCSTALEDWVCYFRADLLSALGDIVSPGGKLLSTVN